MKRHSLSLSLILLSTGVLGACDHYSEKLSALDTELGAPVAYTQTDAGLNNVMPAAGDGGAPYDKALAQAYYARAVQENEVMDYTAAKYFTGKAFSALHGENPAPGQPREFGIAASDRSELNQQRERLVSALELQKTPVNQDRLIAAQVNYDGWLDQVAEGKSGAALTCRDNFMQALADLEDPYAEAGRFAVTFDGQGALTPEGQKALADAAALIGQNTGRPYQILLKAPTAGPDSSRQFDVITAALSQQGLGGQNMVKTYAAASVPAGVQNASYQMPGGTFTEVIVKFAPQGTAAPSISAPATQAN